MKLIADTHCHTVASSHAYSTVLENIAEAKRKKLKYIAITDHTGLIPDSPGCWYFQNLSILPREINGIKILKGIESNVLGPSGRIDIPEFSERGSLDWIIASIHEIAWAGAKTLENCTQAWLNVAKNPIVNVIGHSGLVNFKYDYEQVIPVFKENNKLVEINASSFLVRRGCYENCKKIAEICKKCKAQVIVNSDCHIATHVGRFDAALKLLEEINFPENLIINSDINSFENYLKKYTSFFDSESE